MSEKHIPNFMQPMPVQGVRPEDVVCRDCKHRIKAPFTVDGEVYDLGASKIVCAMYPDDKPLDILFKHAPCSKYERE